MAEWYFRQGDRILSVDWECRLSETCYFIAYYVDATESRLLWLMTASKYHIG